MNVVEYELLSDDQGHKGIVPKKGSFGAACLDLGLPMDLVIYDGERITLPLLIAFDIPIGYCIYMQPRSSTFTKYGLIVPTSVIDCDYKKGVHLQAYNVSGANHHFERGQRLVQIHMFECGQITSKEVFNIKQTERGAFGSSGK